MVHMNQSAEIPITPDVLRLLKERLKEFTPQQRQAAQFLLDNPTNGVASLRQAAAGAGVTPNTLVRLAQAIGLDGFERLRAGLHQQLLRRATSPLDSPDWLDAIGDGSSGGDLLRSVANSALENLQQVLAAAEPARLEAMAREMSAARQVIILGVGTLSPVATLFASLAGSFMENVHPAQAGTMLPVDILAQAKPDDVLFAMTFEPYRREIVDAVLLARNKGLRVFVLTDGWTSPVAAHADEVFIVPASAPHVFASVVPIVAFIEIVLAFLIREGGAAAAERIGEFHRKRFELGVYWPGEETAMPRARE